MNPYARWAGVGVVAHSNHCAGSRRLPLHSPRRRVNRPKRAWSRALISRPPPQWPPPLTDCTHWPSTLIQELSYPFQRQVLEAPIGSITRSLMTWGRGRRSTLRAASASTFTRTSLYLYTLPAALRGL